MAFDKQMPNLENRLRTGLLLAGLVVGLAAGCSGKDTTGGDDPVGGSDAGADASTDASDAMARPDTDQPEPDTGSKDEDPGTQVTAGGFQVFPPIPASCSQPGKKHRVPFYFKRQARTPDGRIPPIRPGDTYRGQEIQPNGVIGAGTMTTRRMRVSEVAAKQCTSSADCPGSLKCGASGVRGAARYCTRQTGIEFVPGTTSHDVDPNFRRDSKQLVVVALDNTASYVGDLPTVVSTLQDAEGENAVGGYDDRATDPTLQNREAVRQFSTYLATAADSRNTNVAFWYFGGQTPTRAQPTFKATSQTDHFNDNLEYPKLALESQAPFVNTHGESQAPLPKTANVYQAIDEIIEDDLGLSKYEGHEKFLFLITDGPNEVYDPQRTKAKIASKLKKHNIKLYIMHLDPTVNPDHIRDLPTYYGGNQSCRDKASCGAPTCSSDADCGNFETCRKATVYARKQADVTETDSKYCMPDYSSGRLGPIDEYADLACQTGGNYIYVTSPDDLVYYSRHLPYLIDGQWSIEAEFSALDERVGLADGFYRLSGVFSGLLAPNLLSTMSAMTPRGLRTSHLNDTRGLLRLQTDDE